MQPRPDLLGLVGDLGFVLAAGPASSITALTDEILVVCAAAEDRQGPSVIVLWLTGDAAADRGWPGDVDIKTVNRWERAVRRLEHSDAVVLAVAEGSCAGPALDLLLAADYRIATVGFDLMLPVNDGHFWPGMAIYRLVGQLGGARARQLVLWGDHVAGSRARDIGLVDELVANAEDAVEAATVLLGRAAGSDLAVRRQLLREAGSASPEEALGTHLAACDRELRRMRPHRDPSGEGAGAR